MGAHKASRHAAAIARSDSAGAREWDLSVATVLCSTLGGVQPTLPVPAVGSVVAAEERAPAPAPAPPSPPPTVLDMLHFLRTQRKLHLMAPAIIFSGAGQGFILGAWMAASVAHAPGLGPQYVGLAGAVYSFVCAGGILAWRKVATIPAYGRRAAFLTACTVQLVWLVAMAGWLSWAGVGVGGGRAPEAVTAAVTFLSILMYGTVDTVWNGFVPATLQTFYTKRNETPCAMAAIRICYAVGFSAQQGVSIGLGPARLPEQALLLAALLAVASACLYHLHVTVCSLDGTERGVGGQSKGEGEGVGKGAAGEGDTVQLAVKTGEAEAGGSAWDDEPVAVRR